MQKPRLHAKSHAVVHRTARRTRLRVPKKFRRSERLHEVKAAIQSVPGVQSVEINHQTGSVLVHHNESPSIIGEIGVAIEDKLPELMAALLMPEEEGAELGLSMLTSLCKVFTSSGRQSQPEGNAGAGSAACAQGAPALEDERVTRAVPVAFVAAGLWTMMREETLLGGLAPLALFYYGFDIYWKMEQERRARLLEMQQAARTLSKQMNANGEEKTGLN